MVLVGWYRALSEFRCPSSFIHSLGAGREGSRSRAGRDGAWRDGERVTALLVVPAGLSSIPFPDGTPDTVWRRK